MTEAQLRQTSTADDYADAVLRQQGERLDSAGDVAPHSLAGIASDGRPLPSLLFHPVITTKRAIGLGASVDRAMALGQAHLEAIVRTQVSDAGRVADGIAVATRNAEWVRVIYGETCSRCILLAGRVYSWKADFQRHPGCDCYAIPTTSEHDARAMGLTADPLEYFRSLSKDEQDRIFTKDGAQAIREGADMGQVVNARKGMSAAGTTTTGTTRFGTAGRRLKGAVRLMPERIYEIANGDHDEAVRLLRQHGYIL
nr:hypothetical protein [Amycolatopsis orientalis]